MLNNKNKMFRYGNAGPMDSNEANIEVKRRQTGWNSGMKPIGLAGGGEDESHNRENHLRLMNNRTLETRNICFVNSAVQLLRATGFKDFIEMQLPPLLLGSTGDKYKLCSALETLYCGQNRGEASAAPIRKLVAEHSNKEYFNNGTQQDAEEFLRDLEVIISSELSESITYKNIQEEHWGEEQIKRIFLDNPPSGTCKIVTTTQKAEHNPFSA